MEQGDKKAKRHLVTAALIYANGPVHIGHLAGCYLPADVYVRYLRMRKEDVLFISGTDEHGVPITLRAKKENSTPQQIVDKYYPLIYDSFKAIGISFDIFSRTGKKEHHEFSADFFLTLYRKGLFKEIETEQFYDEKSQQFLADRYIVGTCPKCGFEGAYGDQCEKCGSSLSPDELINPLSVLSGEKPVKRKTLNWYLPLDEMQPEIEQYVEQHKEHWKSNVYGQCRSWLNQKLQPRAMTRDLDWGVKVPLEKAKGKVLYVWFDAPLGYITFTKELTERWEEYWKREDTEIIHFIGKDNIVFHCIIFPAMLMAHGGYCLAHNVPAMEFMNLEGNKISTSRNWAVWLHEYLQEFPAKQDELRYALLSLTPETSDSEFTWKDFQAKINHELVAILGNMVNRVMVLMHKYFQGKVKATQGKLIFTDSGLKQMIDNAYVELDRNLSQFRFRQSLTEAMNVCRAVNKFLTDREPWKVYEKDPEKAREVLQNALLSMAHIARLIEPFMPFSSRKIFRMLNLNEYYSYEEEICIPDGHTLREPEILFEKITDEQINMQLQKLRKNVEPMKTEEKKEEYCTFDDFQKIHLRTGKILEARKHPDADKLLILKVDTGEKIRTIVSGIATHYLPEAVVGQSVVVVTNLAPRKLRGIESEGMILMAEDKEGRPIFVQPQKEIETGAVVR